MRTLTLVALGYSVLLRSFELALSKHNERRLLEEGARVVPNDGMGLIALVHTLWFVALIVEERRVGPSFSDAGLQIAFGALFVLAEATRFWCMLTLGLRWNARVIVLDGAPRIRKGPYRFLPHPNYVSAVVMLVALPLALGLVYTPALILVPKLWAVRRRIRIEDAALAEAESL